MKSSQNMIFPRDFSKKKRDDTNDLDTPMTLSKQKKTKHSEQETKTDTSTSKSPGWFLHLKEFGWISSLSLNSVIVANVRRSQKCARCRFEALPKHHHRLERSSQKLRSSSCRFTKHIQTGERFSFQQRQSCKGVCEIRLVHPTVIKSPHHGVHPYTQYAQWILLFTGK
jgi:hypothetical protein